MRRHNINSHFNSSFDLVPEGSGMSYELGLDMSVLRRPQDVPMSSSGLSLTIYISPQDLFYTKLCITK